MRDKIISILLNNLGKRISGEQISNKFNISRAAVWKHIKALRQKGYNILSTPGGGYQLNKVPDILSNNTLDYYKKYDWEYKILDDTTSTNIQAHIWAQENAPFASMIIAKKQTKGRGRLGRKWSSPMGGIWMSSILYTKLPLLKIQSITLLTAIAVSKAIEEICMGITLKIKWPNDILLNNKKLCGILVESASDIDEVKYIISGIGINANVDMIMMPDEIKQTAASLKSSGFNINRAELAAKINDNLIDIMNEFNENGEIDGMYDYYSSHLAWMGEIIDIKGSYSSEIVDTGRIMGINEKGELEIENDGIIKSITSGELSIRRRE